MSKWIDFVQMHDSGKTRVWDVVTEDGGAVLGEVRWFGRWRKYSFFPKPDTIYEATCLRDVAAFMDAEMAARKLVIDAVTRRRDGRGDEGH